MTEILQKVALFIEPTALAFLLVYAYGFFHRSNSADRFINPVMGAIFGLACVIAMSSPIILAEGIIVDIRNLFVGMAAAYFGVIGGAVALVIGCAMRLQIGGSGAIIGLMAMTISAIMGLVWALYVRPRVTGDMRAYVYLGTMISLHLIVALFMPSGLQRAFFLGLAPTLLVANLFGAFLLGSLIERERRLSDETRALATAAAIDPLTKLLNRRSAVKAYETLDTEFQPGYGRAMLCIDVDEFKLINDTHGHLCGDQVLMQLAERMATCLRPDDIFSRVSGDEFVIVLNDISSDHAEKVAERCREAIARSEVTSETGPINLTVSIGGAWSPNSMRFKDARSAADAALFQAKERGRNCVAFITVAFTEQAQEKPTSAAA